MRFNTVTWYSKLAAAITFIALPFIGFYLGMKYQEALKTSPNSIIVGKTGDKDNNIGQIIKSDGVSVRLENKNGVLKYTGSVQVPNPCYEVKDEATLAESFPEQVQIRLTTSSDSTTRFECAQVITEKKFSGELKVSSKATVSIYLNGEKID